MVAKAEVTHKCLCSGVNHILVASDGLWNFTAPEESTASVRYSTDLARTALSAVLMACVVVRCAEE